MKKAFTLIELLVVLVIMGILATIATEILLKVYKNYVISKASDKLVYETDLIINEIASKLENRIPNSVIATKSDESGFISIEDLNPANSDEYPIIEWLSKDIYSKRGEWSSSFKRVIPGWSGFVDLKETNSSGNEYNITIPYSKMSIVQEIDGNWSKRWGIKGYDDVFANKLEVLIFSGPDGRGDFSDVNHSYGWYNTQANKVFMVNKIINDDLNHTRIEIQPFNDSNISIYEGFYFVNTAMAIVPVYDKKFNDYNLTFYQNYFPWKGQVFSDGNKSILATHVTNFRFKEQNGLLRLYLCIQDPDVKIDNNEYLKICKEKVVF